MTAHVLQALSCLVLMTLRTPPTRCRPLPNHASTPHLPSHPPPPHPGAPQVVSQPDSHSAEHAALERVRSEYVVRIEGTLRRRTAPNPKLPTGLWELAAERVSVLNTVTQKLPFLPAEEGGELKEDVRLRHRILDLRQEQCVCPMCLCRQRRDVSNGWLIERAPLVLCGQCWTWPGRWQRRVGGRAGGRCWMPLLWHAMIEGRSGIMHALMSLWVECWPLEQHACHDPWWIARLWHTCMLSWAP